MRSQNRQEKRLQREQDTVGANRAERIEQGKLGSHSNLEVILSKGAREEKSREKKLKRDPEEPVTAAVPLRRVARPGKPLKR